MARGVNKVILIGNLGADPETRCFPDGGAVTNITLATSESWKDRHTGEPHERTEWHRVVFRDRGSYRLGEIAGEYLRKGSKIYVEGSLKTRTWEKDGVTHYQTEIIANDMQMLGPNPNNTEQHPSGDSENARTNLATTQDPTPYDRDGDIPF